jgi:3-isopropylmalate dehydratase small subunit
MPNLAANLLMTASSSKEIVLLLVRGTILLAEVSMGKGNSRVTRAPWALKKA